MLSLLSYSRDLSVLLDEIWQDFFSDVHRENDVVITYLRPWKRRLGLIRMSVDTTRTFIGINTLLQHQEIPDYVLITTIAHELVHYTHGFGSPRVRLYNHPHEHGVVDAELEKRGLGVYNLLCNKWIEEEWFRVYHALTDKREVLITTALSV